MTFYFSAKSGERIPAPVVYLNTTSGASVPLADNGAVVTGGDPQGDFIVNPLRVDGDTAVTLHGPDGAQRCTFILAVFDCDCRELAALPLADNTDIINIVPTPGATIVVHSDDSGSHIDGYSPD